MSESKLLDVSKASLDLFINMEQKMNDFVKEEATI
jgi:hypothetical protein